MTLLETYYFTAEAGGSLPTISTLIPDQFMVNSQVKVLDLDTYFSDDGALTYTRTAGETWGVVSGSDFTITVPVDGSDSSPYVFTIEAEDVSANTVSDSFTVYVSSGAAAASAGGPANIANPEWSRLIPTAT